MVVKDRKCQTGAAMLEAAMALPIVLILLITGADLVFASYQRIALQYALTRGARLAVVGASLTAVKSNTVKQSRAFGVPISAGDIRICPETLPKCTTSEESLGGGSSYVRLSVSTEVGMTEMMRHEIDIALLVRTEPI